MLGPAPAWLEYGASDGQLSQLDQLDMCLLDPPDLVWAVEALAAQLHGTDRTGGATLATLAGLRNDVFLVRTAIATGRPATTTGLRPAGRLRQVVEVVASGDRTERCPELRRNKSVMPRAATQSPQAVLPMRPARSNTGKPGSAVAKMSP